MKVTPSSSLSPELVQKQTLVRSVVALGIAVLAWQIIARSQQLELAHARASLATRHNELEEFSVAPTVLKDLPAASEALQRRSKELRTRLAITADTGKLYETIGNLALRQQLRIERIDPLRSSGQAAGSAAKVGIEKTGYAMEVVGTYDGVARFIDQLQSALGVSKVESVRIEPAPISGKDGSLVRATIETQHLRLPPGGIDFSSLTTSATSQPRTLGGAK
jgi:Tfp pilus assembly protein PilO